MTEQLRARDQFPAGRQSFDAFVHAYGEANKGLQAIAAEFGTYSKDAFEQATRSYLQLLSAKSAEQAIGIQSEYAKRASEAYIHELSKLGAMWSDWVRDAYKPQTISK